MNKITKKTIIGAGIITTVIAGALVSADMDKEMKYLHSYETLAFDTIDGDLALNEYVVITENTILPLRTVRTSKIPAYTEDTLYLVRRIPKNRGSWSVTNNLNEIVGKKEVQFLCEGCIYYSEFTTNDGNTFRKQIQKSDYDGMRYIKDYEHPKETETIIFGGLINKALAAIPVFDTFVDEDANTAATSYTLAMTIGSITNPALVVHVNKNDNANDTTSVTYNSVDMGSIREQSHAFASHDREINTFVLANPTTGSSVNIVANFAGSTWAGIAGISYSGVDQSTPVGATATGSTLENACGAGGSGITLAITTTVADSLLTEGVLETTDSGTFTPESSQTERITVGGYSCENCGNTAAGDISAAVVQEYTETWGFTDGNGECGLVLLELLAVADAGGDAATDTWFPNFIYRWVPKTYAGEQ